MGKGSRRRRANKKKTATCNRDGAERPTCIADIPDVVLELVLLRIRTPTCLFRAAATCKLWRRVIAGDGFLERFRSDGGHGSHLLLGHYVATTERRRKINAEFVPSPPRPAIGLRQRLSLDFLIQPGEERHIRRELTDSRGGLLALVCDNWYPVVCDPWTKQYRELPAFPWGEEESSDDDDDNNPVFYSCCGAFLVDAGTVDSNDNSGSPLSSFRLLCACVAKDDYFFYWAESAVFSARDNRWVSTRTFYSREIEDMWHLCIYGGLVGRAEGSIFWADGTHLLALDESTGEFSTFELPLAPGEYRYRTYNRENLRVVGGEGAGAVRIVRVVDDRSLEVLTASRAHGAWECMLESRADLGQLTNTNIEVKPDWSWYFDDTASAAGLLILRVDSPSVNATLLFSLDVETMKMKAQPEPETSKMTESVFPFPYKRPWPQTI